MRHRKSHEQALDKMIKLALANKKAGLPDPYLNAMLDGDLDALEQENPALAQLIRDAKAIRYRYADIDAMRSLKDAFEEQAP